MLSRISQGSFRRSLLVVILSLSVVAVVGCAPKAKSTSAKSVSSLRDTRDELAVGRKQVDTVLLAMNTVTTTPGDLSGVVGKFQAEVKNTASQRARIAGRIKDMKTRAAEYQAKWREGASKLDNADLRTAAAERSEVVRTRFDTIAKLGADASAAYDPFYKSLTEISAYLTHDLTPAAVTAGKPAFDKANAQGKELNVKLDAMLAEIDSVASALAPVKAAAPTK